MARVSVCIPTYNSAAYVRETINSVLRQDFSDYELVICDDASADTTTEICLSYADPRVRYIPFTPRGGQAVNWNRCVDAATGEYVIILHADDVLTPNYLGCATTFLDAHADVGLVHCAVQHIDHEGRPLTLQQLYPVDRVVPGQELWRRLLLEGCVVNPAGVLVRRAVYERVGPFTQAVMWGIDWHMWLRIAIRWNTGYLAEPMALYRQHPASGTAAVFKIARNGSDELWIVDDIFRDIAASHPELSASRRPAVRQVAHRTWCTAETMCQLGFMEAARAGIRASISIWPGIMLQSRVWALWAATYLGYAWFSDMVARRRRLAKPAASA